MQLGVARITALEDQPGNLHHYDVNERRANYLSYFGALNRGAETVNSVHYHAARTVSWTGNSQKIKDININILLDILRVE